MYNLSGVSCCLVAVCVWVIFYIQTIKVTVKVSSFAV